MDKKITLQKPDLVDDGQGGRKKKTSGTGFVTVSDVWAEFITPTLKTVETQGTIVSEMIR